MTFKTASRNPPKLPDIDINDQARWHIRTDMVGPKNGLLVCIDERIEDGTMFRNDPRFSGKLGRATVFGLIHELINDYMVSYDHCMFVCNADTMFDFVKQLEDHRVTYNLYFENNNGTKAELIRQMDYGHKL